MLRDRSKLKQVCILHESFERMHHKLEIYVIVRQAALLIVKVVLRGSGSLLFQSRISTIDQERHLILNAVDYR